MAASIAILLGLRAARCDRAGARRAVGLWTAVVALLALAPLPEGQRLLLALAALPLARAQAGVLWWWLASARATEGLAARLAPDRELVHKLLWALLYALDQVLVLGSDAADAWRATPVAFLALVAPALAVSTAGLAERALGGVRRPRAVAWTWIGVQASAAWEELLFRGLVVAALWPLAGGSAALVVLVGAALFALPHHERGSPSGPRGVAFAFALGAVCLLLGLRAGAIWPGLLLHGGVLGTYAVLRSRRERARARGDLTREGALFLLRLRHGYYVTDWEGERVRRLAGRDEPLAARIRERLAGAGDLVALARGELGELLGHEGERGPPGRAWLRRSGGFLVAAVPEGHLPPRSFPSLGLGVLRALRGLA